MWKLNRLVISGALAAIGLAIPASTPASAAPGSCYAQNAAVTDDWGRTFSTRYVCPTWTGAALESTPYDVHMPFDDSGYMYAASQVWVICQRQGGPNQSLGGYQNNWWLYTQGDQARANTWGYRNAWGHLPATAVSYGQNWQPIPGVPYCPKWY